MGTPPFAVRSLDALHAAGIPIAGVVTAPDRPAGRGLQLRPSAVKQRALELSLPVLQPERMDDPGFITALSTLAPAVIVVVAFRKLPRAVYTSPPLGTINLHASLLPDYRGAAPINWAVINGEVRTGVTTFYITERIDTGDVIHQDAIDIGADDTAGEVHDRLAATGATLVVRTVREVLAGTAPRRGQQDMSHAGTLHAAPKLTADNSRIAWDRPMQQVHDHIRGLSPHPGAWTTWQEGDRPVQHFKVLRTQRTDQALFGGPGVVRMRNDDLTVCCADGVLRLLEVQLEGRRRMAASEFVRGQGERPDVHLG